MSNTVPVAGQYNSGSVHDDLSALDRLPKAIRMALAECDYEFSAVQMFDVFKQVKSQLQVSNLGFPVSDGEVWSCILSMISRNDNELGKKDRQYYEQLVEEFAAEKRARIEAAFRRAS